MARARLRGPWSRAEINTFFDDQVIPLRLACHTASGFPTIVSLWYLRDEGSLWCAVPDSSFTARSVRADPRCGFEVAVNRPPYRGTRGLAEVTLHPERGGRVLRRLIERYLGNDDSELARWLLSREQAEVALRLTPIQLTSWDYRQRMADVPSSVESSTGGR